MEVYLKLLVPLGLVPYIARDGKGPDIPPWLTT